MNTILNVIDRITYAILNVEFGHTVNKFGIFFGILALFGVAMCAVLSLCGNCFDAFLGFSCF